MRQDRWVSSAVRRYVDDAVELSVFSIKVVLLAVLKTFVSCCHQFHHQNVKFDFEALPLCVNSEIEAGFDKGIRLV